MLAFGVLVMHILTNFVTPYGFHRDELLYLAMGEHLRLWRMDFPPFIAIIARVSHELFGESLPGIRLAPAFAHAGLVYAAAFATALFGGRRSAQTLAALGIALCPYFLRPGAMLQPVVFDQLWWTLALLGITMRIRDGDSKHWMGTGLFLGLAALTKFSVAFLATGFVVAILFTGLRRDLLTKWPWIALIIATIVGHPSITGQIFLGWPVLEQMSNLQAEQLSHVGPLDFLSGQLSVGPVLFLAIGGIVWLFVSGRRSAAARAGESGSGDRGSQDLGSESRAKSPRAEDLGSESLSQSAQARRVSTSDSDPKLSDPSLRAATANRMTETELRSESWLKRGQEELPSMRDSDPKLSSADYRPIAVVAATAFLILLALRGKAYYIAPIYPILSAAGAAALDRLAIRISPARPTKVLAIAAAAVALYGMVTLPFGLPLLAPPQMTEVSKLLGQRSASNTGEALTLPQDYSDMLGWRELATMTAVVWRALPPADTANAILIGTNYGRAGALDLFGRDLGLPSAVSAAGSYWFFGPGTKTGSVAVVPTNEPEALKGFYSDCRAQAQTNNPWGVPEERSVQVYVCRGSKGTIQDAWPSLAGHN